MSMYDRVAKGEFYTKIVVAYQPVKHPVNVSPYGVSPEEYMMAIKAADEEFKQRQDIKRLETIFKKELCKEYKVPYFHPFAQQMLAIAWVEMEFESTIERFEELLPLWKLYNERG